MSNSIKKIWEKGQKLSLKPLQGGSLEISLFQLKTIYRLAWFASDGADPIVRLSSPGEKISIKWKKIDARSHSLPDATIVGHSSSSLKWQALRNVEDISALLVDLQEGSELELITIDDDHPVACQRYSGIVKDKIWTITDTYPEMTQDFLQKAVQFSQQAEKDSSIEVDDPEQAAQIVKAASLEFEGTHMKVVQKGNKISAEIQGEFDQGIFIMMAAHAFYVLLGDGPWDFSEIQAENEESAREVEIMNENLMQAFQNKPITSQPQGKAIWKGKKYQFLQSNIRKLEYILEEDIAIVDQEMSELGLEPLGDILCDKFTSVIMRVYVGAPETGIYGCILASTDGTFATEFYSSFANNTSLTTTTHPLAEDLERKGIFRNASKNFETAKVYAEHKASLKEKRFASPRRTEKDLVEFAQTVDEFLTRQHSR